MKILRKVKKFNVKLIIYMLFAINDDLAISTTIIILCNKHSKRYLGIF
jgi:hypothetical protein